MLLRKILIPCKAVPVLVWMTVMLAAENHAANIYLEAATSRGNPRTVQRSNARKGVAVRLGTGESIHMTFCLRQTTLIQVLNVLYSNDGNNETVGVAVDDRSFLGTFTSHNRSDWGRLWNVFLPSPTFPHTLALYPGWHTLRVGVLSAPSDGIEVDSVRMWFSDEGLTRAMLDCLLVCTSSLPAVPPNTGAQLWQDASAKQASYRTECAEEDNVKVPLYLGGISEYTVTATMPTYVSFANRREANTTGCGFLSPVLFSFTRLSNKSFSATTPGASLFGYRSPGSGKQVLRIEFQLQGRSKGLVDAEIGSVLTTHFRKTDADIVVRIAYLGRKGRLTGRKNTVVRAPSRQYVQHFEDHTWREGTNVVLLEFQSTGPADVTGVTLERRPMRGEKVQTVYRSDSLVVEAVEVDFWWRRPESLILVNGETGQTWTPVDFFRVSLHVPWNGGFAQVFVMYQDGNVRLAPLPPPGMDWIPFGSSVIIGYSDPAHLRPSAPVTSVTFYPSTLSFHVRYQDGGSVKLKLSSTQTQTLLVVKDIESSGRNVWGKPFATFRSMHVEDGNSDCDSVLVDGKSYRSVMDNWGTLKGSSFFFFRRCESQHLTLSPDMRVDVKKTSLVHGNGAGVSSNNWWWEIYSRSNVEPTQSFQ
ncbi:uncharacterized protein LOC143283334 isoform X2 [Babylonia areolata]|uniref:uncharacterized protein LOC143283334 isoform X2 n=1 Tax=Babylonia areolata TaxID=304850 RepID=UPI003FD3B1E2